MQENPSIHLVLGLSVAVKSVNYHLTFPPHSDITAILLIKRCSCWSRARGLFCLLLSPTVDPCFPFHTVVEVQITVVKYIKVCRSSFP